MSYKMVYFICVGVMAEEVVCDHMEETVVFSLKETHEQVGHQIKLLD